MSKIVSVLEDLEYLLSEDPAMVNLIPPQRLLHALLPDTSLRSKIMPQGSSYADVWMLKKGDPFKSVDAALTLVHEVNKDYYLHLDLYHKGKALCRAGLYLDEPGEAVAEGDEISVAEGASETLPGAIILALLTHKLAVDKDKVA